MSYKKKRSNAYGRVNEQTKRQIERIRFAMESGYSTRRLQGALKREKLATNTSTSDDGSKQDGETSAMPSRSRLPRSAIRNREKNSRGVRAEYSPWIQLRPRVSCRGLSLQRSQRRTVRGSRTREPVSGIGNILGDQACERERDDSTERASERARERERLGRRKTGRRDATCTRNGASPERRSPTVGLPFPLHGNPARTPLCIAADPGRGTRTPHQHARAATSLRSAQSGRRELSAAAPPISSVSHMISGATENFRTLCLHSRRVARGPVHP